MKLKRWPLHLICHLKDKVHPKKSVCNCPFAEGRRVICKHMVALDLGIFPEKEQQMMDYIEEQNQLYDQEYEQEIFEKQMIVDRGAYDLHAE